LLLLERLKAEERAALILREAFQYSYDEIARMLGKRADACRQMVHRAKKAVQSATAAAPPPEHERRRIVAAFLRALEQGDEAGVLRLISQDAVWRADGGGKAPATAVVLRGKDDLAKLAIGFARKARGVVDFRIVDLAGEPALAWIHEQNLIAVWTMECGADGIVAFNNITNPDKLRHTLT
jgi:RNA polymerase sigma-70 factor (ECF subfamily)